MERMDMHSRNEYLKVLRERYLKLRPRKRRSGSWMNIAAIPVRQGNMSSGRCSPGWI